MTGDQLPAPPVPAECDCTDLDGFMLNVERLMASELVALSTHEIVGAAVFLWCRAWKQRPASSLPDDERVLAAYARMPLSRFRKLRDDVMRGFTKCSDGRFYHRVLAEEAMRAFDRKKAFQTKRETETERLRKWRQQRRGNGVETRFVPEGQDRTGHHESDLDVTTAPTHSAGPASPNGAGAPPGESFGFSQSDVKTAIFGAGLRWMMANTGDAEAPCRSFLGLLIRDHGEGNTASVLMAAERVKPVDPRAWMKRNIEGNLNGQTPRSQRAGSQVANAAILGAALHRLRDQGSAGGGDRDRRQEADEARDVEATVLDAGQGCTRGSEGRD